MKTWAIFYLNNLCRETLNWLWFWWLYNTACCTICVCTSKWQGLWWNLWKSNAEFQMLNKPTSFLILRSAFVACHKWVATLMLACKNSDELLIWLIAWKIYIQNLLLILSSCSSSSHYFVYAAWDAFHHMGNLRQLTSWYNRCWCCMLALLCSLSIAGLPRFLTRMCYCRNLMVTDWTWGWVLCRLQAQWPWYLHNMHWVVIVLKSPLIMILRVKSP